MLRCGRRWYRDYATPSAAQDVSLLSYKEKQRIPKRDRPHLTARRCDERQCRGRLRDTLVRRGEELPVARFERALAHARRTDLCIVLGSSLRLLPANTVPEAVARGVDRRLVEVRDAHLLRRHVERGR